MTFLELGCCFDLEDALLLLLVIVGDAGEYAFLLEGPVALFDILIFYMLLRWN